MASSGLAPFSPGLLLPLLLPLGSGAAKTRLQLVLETEDNAWMLFGITLASSLSLAAIALYMLHIICTVMCLMLRSPPQSSQPQGREEALAVPQVTRGQYRSRSLVVSVHLPPYARRWLDRLRRLGQETQQDPPANHSPLEELAPEEPSAEEQEGTKLQEP